MLNFFLKNKKTHYGYQRDPLNFSQTYITYLPHKDLIVITDPLCHWNSRTGRFYEHHFTSNEVKGRLYR